nr:MAG TPA: ryanodine receptor [Caudoviricetes sp.]
MLCLWNNSMIFILLFYKVNFSSPNHPQNKSPKLM